MNSILNRLYSIFLKSIPESKKDEFIQLTISNLKKKDPLTYAYTLIGVLKYQDEYISGERNVLESVIKDHISKNKDITFFDVGANVGNYSKTIHELYPNAIIYAFEPNPNTFINLQRNLRQISQIFSFDFGMGERESNNLLYTYKDDLTSEHASIFAEHKDVICEELAQKEITSIPITIKTLDNFCERYNIAHIDFLKIDTEGFEYSVLKGAKKLISENRITFIQFEFNVANILSRTFLRDFYDLLFEKYEFYRLDTKGLIPLGRYDSSNEIFKYQNILAINRKKNEESNSKVWVSS